MIQLIVGYIADLFFGDPYWLFHPVRWLGKLIQNLEKVLLKENSTAAFKKISGAILLIVVASSSFIISYTILILAGKIHLLLALFIESFMIYQIFATKCLDVETRKVYHALKKGDIESARKWISYLVSRDTAAMTDEEIIKAAIETISENLGDGVIAPMFYVILGGAPIGWVYKSVNTLDSMVGYKNKKYNDFGYASAKFDDVLNYIPARLTALFILIAGWILRMDLRNGCKMMLRDRHNHASPNSAYPESAAAGVLNIQLGGKATYFGETTLKPTMGDAHKVIDLEALNQTRRLLYTTSVIGIIVMLAVKVVII